MKELHQIVSLLRDIRLTQLEGSGSSSGSGGSGSSGGTTPSGVTSESVTVLPSPEEAKEGVIYVVPSNEEGSDNKYIEYIIVNGTWERLGSNPSIIESDDLLGLF